MPTSSWRTGSWLPSGPDEPVHGFPRPEISAMLDALAPDGSFPPPQSRTSGAPTPPKGAPVIGADGLRLGMVSALEPDPDAPTHLLVFVAERQQLIPREYPLPVSAIVRIDDAGTVHVGVTRDGLRAGGAAEVEEPRSRGAEKTS